MNVGDTVLFTIKVTVCIYLYIKLFKEIMIKVAVVLILISYSNICETKWTEEQYQTFEKSLMILAEKYFPPQRFRRAAPCPGGNGKFGFNSYQMLTNIVLGFNAVSSIIANINNNLNNNNNNNNQNDVGNVQGTSQVSIQLKKNFKKKSH